MPSETSSLPQPDEPLVGQATGAAHRPLQSLVSSYPSSQQAKE